MYHVTSLFPQCGDVSTEIFDGNAGRIRIIRLGNVTIHVKDRPTLEALYAALDAIRADMDAVDMASWAPGELAEVFGK